MVGLIGNIEFAKNIKELVAIFLKEELKLELSDEKTKITHMKKDRAHFLGFRFWVHSTAVAKVTKRFNAKAKKRIDSRINQVRV